MIAYKGNEDLKKELVEEMKSHREQDQIVQGFYGSKKQGKFEGCAVGCAIDSLNTRQKMNWKVDDHAVYELELGIPRTLAFLEDIIFEGLSPASKAADFAVNFLEAIPVAADLSLIVPRFMVWLLADKDQGVIRFVGEERFKDQHSAITMVASLYQRIVEGGIVSEEEWKEAEKQASAARSAAWSAAESAAWSAARSAAWSAARSAARSAAWSAAESAAESAAWSAAESAAESAGVGAAYDSMAQKMLELLKAA